MSKTNSHDTIASNTAAVDAFLSLSQVYLTGIERLSALNLTTARDAVESTSSATNTLAEAGAARDWNVFLSSWGRPVWEKAMAYSREAIEIIAQTQGEMSKLIVGQQAGQPQMISSGLAGWNAMSDMFATSAQLMSASAANSIAATSGRAKAAAALAAEQRKAA